MQVFALFSDSTHSQVIFKDYQPDPEDDRVELIYFKISDSQVKESAQKGCYAAYRALSPPKNSFLQMLSKQHHIKRGEKFCFSCQFETSISGKIIGESAGLAFSLKFAQKILSLKGIREEGYSIGATGIIGDDENDEIDGVDGINAKLQAATHCLRSGDKLFYPHANEQDIRQEIRERVKENGIQLIPVTTIKQAIEELISPESNKSDIQKKRRQKKLRWLVMSCLLFVLILATIAYQSNCPTYDEIMNDLEEGRFLTAKQKCETFSSNCTSLRGEGITCGKAKRENRIETLYDEISDIFGLDIKFRYFRVNENQSSEQQPIVLSRGDGYRFDVTPNDSCFLYVYQFDANHRLKALFPQSVQYLLIAGRTYRIPGSRSWYILDDAMGSVERIYIIAARWRSRDLEQLYEKIARASGNDNEKEYQEFEGRLRMREKAQKDRIAVFYQEFVFGHE